MVSLSCTVRVNELNNICSVRSIFFLLILCLFYMSVRFRRMSKYYEVLRMCEYQSKLQLILIILYINFISKKIYRIRKILWENSPRRHSTSLNSLRNFKRDALWIQRVLEEPQSYSAISKTSKDSHSINHKSYQFGCFKAEQTLSLPRWDFFSSLIVNIFI